MHYHTLLKRILGAQRGVPQELHVKGKSMMSIRENTALVQRLIEEVWNQGRQELLDDLLTAAPHVNTPRPAPPDTTHLHMTMCMLRRAFPDWHITIDASIGMPDRVLIQWYAEGAQSASFMGLAPTQRRVATTGISLFSVVGGRLQEAQVSAMISRMLRQIYTTLTSRPDPACVTRRPGRVRDEEAELITLEVGAPHRFPEQQSR